MTNSVSRHFAAMPDPRSSHGLRSPLVSLITIAICAVLCGAEDYTGVAEFGRAREPWFRTFLGLPERMPCDDTFRRVFARLDPDAFERCFRSWTGALAGVLSGVVSVDGKTLRRSFDSAAGAAAIRMVSAWASEHGLVFGQVAVDGKSNEITAIPKLLELLDIKGVTVTIDAMGCQKSIARHITERGGEYVLAVKENQPTLHADVARVFARAWASEPGRGACDEHVEVDKGHGRIERRTTTLVWDRRALVEVGGEAAWPGVRCLVRVKRERTINQTTTTAVQDFISSTPTHRAERMAQAVRAHWEVENRLHWRLDVTFDEDRSRVRKGHGAQNMSRLRRLGLNLLQQDRTKKMGIKNKRLAAAWSQDYLVRLLSGG